MEKEMQSKEKAVYSAECQPKSSKIALSLVVGWFFSFNLLFFSPIDFYLSNWSSLLIPLKSVLWAFIPTTLLLFAAVFIICIATGKKYHIITVSLIFSIGLAMYIQSNFLSLSLGELDGSKYSPGVIKILINIIIWVAIISAPLLVYRFNRVIFSGFIAYISIAISIVEAVTVVIMFVAAFTGENANAFSHLAHANETYYVTTTDEFTYSSNKNYIIILTDAYELYCFDNAVNAEPDCVSEFDGFTYYHNTLGMYGQTTAAIPYMLTGETIDNTSPYDNDLLFSTLKENYKIDLYGTTTIISEDIYKNYSDNYIEQKITYKNYIYTFLTLSKVTMYRCMPEAIKNIFWLYSDELHDTYSFGGSVVYSYDDLDFYNRIKSDLNIIDENCFKFIYLYGIHVPRNITSDLQRTEDWSIEADEQAIALNKILSEYFKTLKENGVYDNSEIILLADHGLYETGNEHKFPLLMIKRAGETRDGITVNNAPISHADLYPTFLYLAGYDTGEDTVFDIDENAVRERYFADTNEYITDNIE